jgi:hypothetical protein
MLKNIICPVPDAEEAMRRFNVALRRVMRVSKEDLNQRMDKEKASRGGKPRRGPKPKQMVNAS